MNLVPLRVGTLVPVFIILFSYYPVPALGNEVVRSCDVLLARTDSKNDWIEGLNLLLFNIAMENGNYYDVATFTKEQREQWEVFQDEMDDALDSTEEYKENRKERTEAAKNIIDVLNEEFGPVPDDNPDATFSFTRNPRVRHIIYWLSVVQLMKSILECLDGNRPVGSLPEPVQEAFGQFYLRMLFHENPQSLSNKWRDLQ